jgi:hypothetical protein
MTTNTLGFTPAAPVHWANDMAKFSRALEPYAFTIDGVTLLRPDAPANLARPYRSLTETGYANGWLT